MSLTAFAMNLNASVMAALNPFFAETYGWSEKQLGVLLAAAGVAGGLGALAFGPFVDRWGRRGPLLAGLAVFSLASAGHGFTEDYATLVGLRAVAGAAVGVCYSSASAVVADTVPYQRRGAAMGVFTAGLFLAVPLGLPVAVEFAKAGAWQGIFWVQGGLGMGALAVCAIVLPRLPASGVWVRPLSVLRRPQVQPALLAIALYVGVFSTLVNFVGTFLDESGLLARAEHGALWVALGLCSAIGTLAFSRLSDRWGKRNFVLVSTMGAATCVVALTRCFESFAAFAAIGALLAVVTSARTGPFQALFAEFVPSEERGTLMGLRSAAMQLGIGACTWLGSLAYEAEGFRGLLYAVTAGMVLSWALVRAFVREVS